MARSSRIQPRARDLTLAVQAALAPQVRQKLIAERARQALDEAQAQNTHVLGQRPPHDTFVDGRAEAPLDSVNPDHGVIVFRFNLATDIFEWIDEQLILHSPVLTERFARSHVFFADGEQSDPSRPASGDVFVFLNTQPYARKIERGQSSQAPDGVYEVVATLAARRFGNIARIRFSFRSFQAGAIVYNPGAAELRRKYGRAAAHDMIKQERDTRQPAIIIAMR